MPTQEQMARRYNDDGTINQHATHRHDMYGMNCERFDLLVERAGGRCELCDRSEVFLQIDHDHETKEVRGLLCPGCNTHMSYVDGGLLQLIDRDRAYLSKPPIDAQFGGTTKPRTLRVPDELWAEVTVRAAERGESVSDVVRRALARYARRSK